MNNQEQAIARKLVLLLLLGLVGCAHNAGGGGSAGLANEGNGSVAEGIVLADGEVLSLEDFYARYQWREAESDAEREQRRLELGRQMDKELLQQLKQDSNETRQSYFVDEWREARKLWALTEGGYTRYDLSYTVEGRQAAALRSFHKHDPHVWVYSSEFAERFGMPKRWADDDLEGVLAVAFRIEWEYYRMNCGYFGEVQNCAPTPACILDLYIPEEVDLPWNTDLRYDSIYGVKSVLMLRSNLEDDKPQYLQRRTRRGSDYPIGLDLLIAISNASELAKNSHMYMDTIEFERPLYKGINFISASIICNFVSREDIWLVAGLPEYYSSGSVKGNRVDLEFPESIAHVMKLPTSFIYRAAAYSEQVYEPHSVFNMLRDRLRSQSGAKSDKGGQ